MNRIFIIVLIYVLSACGSNTESVIEVNGKVYVEGSDYLVLEKPLLLDGSPLTNVIEIFWYGCPHCENFELILQEWIKKLPAGMRFGRSPAIWNDVMIVHAKAYFMAQHYHFDQAFHMQLFTRILGLRAIQGIEAHKNHIASLFNQHGINRDEFDQLYDAQSIKDKIDMSQAIMYQAGISSTPSFLINGKYLLTGAPFKSHEELLAVVSHLLKLELDGEPIDWW